MKMVLIEGIGDELTLCIVFTVTLILIIASWLSTRVNANTYRHAPRPPTSRPLTLSSASIQTGPIDGDSVVRQRVRQALNEQQASSIQSLTSSTFPSTSSKSYDSEPKNSDTPLSGTQFVGTNDKENQVKKIEDGSGNSEEGTRKGEDGSGNSEEGTRKGEDGSGNSEDRTRKGEDGSDNSEEGTRRGEDGSGNSEEGTRRGELVSSNELDVNNKREENKEGKSVSKQTENVDEIAGMDRGENDANTISVKVKFLNDEERQIRTVAGETIGLFRRKNFSAELSRNQRVRFIFNGQILSNDNATLQSCGVSRNSIIHCLLTPIDGRSNVNQQSRQETNQDHLVFDDDDMDLGKYLMPMFGFILLSIWYCRFEYTEYFNSLSTFSLVFLTTIYSTTMFFIWRSAWREPENDVQEQLEFEI